MTISSKAWQLIADAKIEQAIRDGQFENLDGFGKPLDIDLSTMDDFWWLKEKAKREQLNLLPPAMILKREVEQETQEILNLEDEQAVRQRVRKINRTIIAANMKILWGPPSQVMPINETQFVQKWKTRSTGQH